MRTLEDFNEFEVVCRLTLKPETTFTCNVCGAGCVFGAAHYIDPELPSCERCASNVRIRWLVHRLSLELFGRGIPLSQFPTAKSIKGIGLTDPPAIATILEERLNYRNTYFHGEPRLDIRCDPSPIGELDFLIASEVFEHIEPPVMRAFMNAARLLKPSGVLLFTAPWLWDGNAVEKLPDLHDWKLEQRENQWIIVNRKANGEIEQFRDLALDGGAGCSLGETREHFPELHDWTLSQEQGSWLLTNTRRDGTVERFHNLVFHRGPGLALEMRLFTRRGLESNLRAAGFNQMEFEVRDHPEFGIIFPYSWTRPLVARLSGGSCRCGDPPKTGGAG